MSIPASTYRLQLSPAQDFAAARGLVDYLESLGVGALYCSPILQAAPGSTHGYDVVDPTRANDQLGGESGRRDLVATLRAAGLGVLVDLVPNHMGVAVPEANPSWWSLLRDGPDSEYASWYDADLSTCRLLIPVLGSPEDVAALELVDGELRYYEHRYPVAPGTGRGHPAGGARAPALPARALAARQRRADLPALLRRLRPRRGPRRRPGGLRRHPRRGAALARRGPARRPAHRPPRRPLRARRLPAAAPRGPRATEQPGCSSRRSSARTRRCPCPGPSDGTTGYEALREIGGLFVDPRGEALVDAVAAEHTGVREGLSPTEHAARRLVTDEILVAEVRRIAALVPGDDDPEKVRDAVAELLCSFPVYRSYLPEGRVVAGPRGRHRGHGTPGARRDRPHDPRRHARRARRRPDAPHRADQRDGHRQGRRGHHVLPLEPVRRAQRGRRGPRPLRGRGRPSSTPAPRPATPRPRRP